MTWIDHQQARHLIQRSLSVSLSNENRKSLDAHLEHCTQCRAYANQLEALEKHLRRDFHARWDPIPGPSAEMAHPVAELTRARLMNKNIFAYLGAAAFGMVLIALTIFTISVLPDRSVSPSQNQTVENAENNQLPPETAQPVRPTTTPTSQETASSPLLNEVDAGLIAFASQQDGNGEIYVMRPNGDEVRNLTNDPAWDDFPVWSPDGQKLAFISARTGSAQAFVMNSDGSGRTQLTQLSQPKEVVLCSETLSVSPGSKQGFYYLDWSPDGKYLVSSLGMNIEGNMVEPLFLISADGSGVVQLTTDGNDINPQWSPDGRRIAFNRLAGCDGSGHDIYAINSDGSGLTNLTSSEASETSAFAWSPDGSQIAYFSENTGSEDQKRAELKLMNSDGSNQVTLLDLGLAGKYLGSLAWSPDGKHLAFVPPHESNDAQIYLMDADGSNQEQLTVNSDHYFDLSWSPHGDWLAYAAGLDQSAIYLLDVKSVVQSSEQTAPARITTPGGQYTNPRWQPNAFEPIVRPDEMEILADVDLNCDGLKERIRIEPGSKAHYFNYNLTYESILLETTSEQNPRTLWEYSAQDASVSYFTPNLVQIEACQQFLAVLGDEGPGSGLKVFRWDGETMKEVLRVPGRYLFAEPGFIEEFVGITPPPSSLGIMSLVQSGTKNLWTITVFQWDGADFKQIIREEVRYPGGG